MAGSLGNGCLIAFAGGIGSGKSTIANAVSEALDVPVHSIDDDKRAIGATHPDFETWVAEGVPFPDDFRGRVFDRSLGRLAELVVDHPVVIVEETFHRAALRDSFFDSARRIFGRVCVIEVAVAPEIALAHLEHRARHEADHMAGTAMFKAFAAAADPIDDADYVVENNGDLGTAVDDVCAFIRREVLS